MITDVTRKCHSVSDTVNSSDNHTSHALRSYTALLEAATCDRTQEAVNFNGGTRTSGNAAEQYAQETTAIDISLTNTLTASQTLSRVLSVRKNYATST